MGSWNQNCYFCNLCSFTLQVWNKVLGSLCVCVCVCLSDYGLDDRAIEVRFLAEAK
jgi:hypothetical protein